MSRIVLCADASSLGHPELIGLGDVSLETVPWLVSHSVAEEARAYLRATPGVEEVWVASSDDMDAFNVAAALRKDNPARRVFLILFEMSGSALSRAEAADVSGVLSKQGLARRFALEQRRYAALSSSGSVSASERAAACSEVKRDVVALREETAPYGADANQGAANGGGSTDENLRDSPAFLLSVVGGGGGVGKSAVSAVAAHILASRGLRVLLIDCDLQFGDLHHLMGLDEPATIDAVLDGRLEDALASRERGRVQLLAAPRNMEQAEAVEPMLARVIEAARRVFDVVVANTGSGWGESHAVLLEQSSRVLFLVDQRSSSVRACRHAVDLCMRCGIATGSFVYAVNRCSRNALFTSIDVSCALQGAHVLELKDGGDEVEELLGTGSVAELAAGRNDLCASVEAALDELLPISLQRASGRQVPDSYAGSFGDARRKPRRKRRGRRGAAAHRGESEVMA